MKLYINDTEKISEVSIPGTHDSAAYKLNGLSIFTSSWAKTQNWTIKEQSEHGIRYLDLRIYDDLSMHHGIAWVGENLTYHLNEVVNFLKNNPDDFILIRLKSEEQNSDKKILRENLKRIFLDSKIHKYFAQNITHQTTVSEVRGKIIVIDDTAGGNPINSGLSWADITKQDIYKPISKEEKWKAVLAGVELKKELRNTLFFNHLSYTFGLNGLKNLSYEMNNRFFSYLSNDLKDGHIDINNLGIIIMDFPSDKLIEQIILRNQKKKTYDWTENTPVTAINPEQVTPETVHKGDPVDLTDNITGLLEGSKVEVVSPVDPNKVGEQTGKVKMLPKTSGEDSSIITIFGYLFLYVSLVTSYYKKRK